MDLTATLTQIVGLSVDDRLQLIEAIWDSISLEPTQLILTQSQKQELSRRLLDNIANPSEVVSWQSIKCEAIALRSKHRILMGIDSK